ncbi:ATP-binding protein [Thermodesulfobium sp. 4217-1]|uniref:ATP-binding protein n=1 Tax=Thermodesulfobium sp. 4217-1 TaxID=3120013 RepID=UPI00322156BC
MDFTFENFVEEFNNFVKISQNEINVSNYWFIEPIGGAILKALELENSNLNVRTNPSYLSSSYIKTLSSKYNIDKNYIPLEIVDFNNIRENGNKIVNLIIRNLHKEDKNDLSDYLIYMTGELLNNAVYHSLSDRTPVISGQYFSKKGKIQICIIDRGVGFLSNLRGKYNVFTESEAIIKALEKGVSSPPSKVNLYYSEINHAGYGLYTLRRIIEETNGRLIIISNNCAVKLGCNNIKILSEEVNWKGVIVVFELSESGMSDILKLYMLQYFLKAFVWNDDDDDKIF